MLFLVPLLLVGVALADTTVQIDGTDYIDLGLQGFGYAAADARDKFGDTISFGSSVKYQKDSLQQTEDGNYTFITYNLPDRGWNVNGTVDFSSRIYKFQVTFYAVNESATPNIEWTYLDSILLKDFNGNYLTGLDANTTVEMNGFNIPGVTYHGDGWGNNLNSSSTTTRVSMDSEALALIEGDIANGFWISDEYGPGLFRFDSNGQLQEYVTAPNSILPYVDGKINFSSNNSPVWDKYTVADPSSGREDNHGYEGMDLSSDGKTLYALLQSAAMQEGGDKDKYSYNARLMKYDLSSGSAVAVGEYVIVLPTYVNPSSGKTKTAAQSELLYVTDDVVMVLPRDSSLGRGQDDGTNSVYRHVDLYSLKNATNILGQYDSENDQIASSQGKLVSGITPATHYEWIDINDNSQLNKYGVHNGGDDDSTLLNEKWEGLTLIPIPCTTDEYFLLAVSDNDFTTTNGWMNFGKTPFDSGDNFENQSLMWRVKLAAIPHNEGTCSSSTISTIRTFSSSIYDNSTVSTTAYVNITSSLNTAFLNSTSFSLSSTQTSFENSTTSQYDESTDVATTVICTLNKCSGALLKTGVSNADKTATAIETITSCEGGCSNNSKESSFVSTAVGTSTASAASTTAEVSAYEGLAASSTIPAMTVYALVIALTAYLL